MMPRPPRCAHPLETPGRANHRIVCHGVARRVVQVMRPLVNLVGARLEGSVPGAGLLNVRHTVRAEDAQNLGGGDVAEVLGHKQVDEVIDVRQPLAAELVHRHGAVDAERPDVRARLGDVLRAGVQAVDEVGVAGAEGGGQSAVAAAQVHDEAALGPRRVEDRPGVIRRGRSRGSMSRPDKGGRQKRCGKGPAPGSSVDHVPSPVRHGVTRTARCAL